MPMVMHLQKLSVGTETIEGLSAWQDKVMERRIARGLSAHSQHVTRMMPKQKAELLDNGSIYWVIKGVILCRNQIVDLEETRTQDGRKACCIVLKPGLIAVRPMPRRAFQGWRYLKAEDAPEDLDSTYDNGVLPVNLRLKLVELGAW